MDNTKVTKKESFLKDKSKEDLIKDLESLLKGRVLEAYVFGSFLSENFNADSDLDLILVTKIDKPFYERVLDFPEILDLNFDVDLLVYTPEEFEKIKKEEKTAFWENAFQQMVRIV